MKKLPPVALIASGKLSDSPVARFLVRSSRLGPVLSPSLRVASRISNTLRAGHPVKGYAALESCHVILISVPDDRLPATIAALSSSGVSWRGKVVVLGSTWLGSGELDLLASRGASIGSVSRIPGLEDTRYLVEGDRLAVRETKRLIEHGNCRLITVEREDKPLYLASLTCTGSLAFGLLHVAAESLRRAGVQPLEAAAMMEKQLSKTLRAYRKGGRKAFPEIRGLAKQVGAMAAIDPELAHYLEESSRLASRLQASSNSKLSFHTARTGK